MKRDRIKLPCKETLKCSSEMAKRIELAYMVGRMINKDTVFCELVLFYLQNTKAKKRKKKKGKK